MRTKTKILTTVAAGALALGAFAAGAAADDTTSDDVVQARAEMHDQMAGGMGGMAGMGGMMSGDVESMQAMHDAMDPAAMDAMHDEMVELLPPELRDDAEAMHEQMAGAMGDGASVDHAAHHPTGS